MHKSTLNLHSMFLIVSLVFILAACSRATPTSLIEPFPTIPNASEIESAPCPLDTPGEAAVTCGKLAVPEDYKNPDGAQIHLMVATFHSSGDSHAKDPVIVIYIDPGGLHLEFILRYGIYDSLLAEIQEERDLVFYDMRGVGYSEPEIACPDVVQAQYALLEQKMSRESRANALAEITLDCRRKLVQDGIHLEFYTTAQNVADLNAVKNALGADKVNLLVMGYGYGQGTIFRLSNWRNWADKVNLLGMGYGSYLALRVMQDYPDRIRSALLGSPYSDHITNSDIAGNLQRVLDMMFERCKADEKCNAAYPSLEEDFYAVVEELNRTPAEITISYNKKTIPVLVTGDQFLDLTRGLASNSDIAKLPKLVQDIKNDRAYHLMEPMQDYWGYIDYQNIGIETTIFCQAYLEAKENPRPAGQAHQALRDWQEFNQQLDEQTCATWFTSKTEPSGNPGRSSNVPALVLSGEWNAIVPPEWVKENTRPLAGATLVEVPNMGWVSWFGNCQAQLAAAFLKDPGSQLDTGCTNEAPEINFILPMR